LKGVFVPTMYFLYTVLVGIGMILLTPYYIWRSLRGDNHFKNLRERMGNFPDNFVPPVARDRAIWVHAVSVGEVLAAKPLVDALKQRFTDRQVFVSTTTITGQRVAREQLVAVDAVFYFPFDWPGPVRRSFEQIRPALVLILETEIWPTFLREAHHRSVPVIFVNSRISDRSFRRFFWFRRVIGGFFAKVLSNGETFLTQSRADARRLTEMGAPEENIEVIGNLKFDHEPPALGTFGRWLEKQLRDQDRWPVLVAGSIVAGEEDAILAAYDIVQRKWRHALLILAPRKPERFGDAVARAVEHGWKVVRRTALDLREPLNDDADVLVLDSLGELAGIYALADAVFIGGSLVRSGGHNILEPAWFSKPPVFGPSMENFREIAARFSSEGAGIQVSSGEQLGQVWMELIENPSISAERGRQARALVEVNRGATERYVNRIAMSLEASRGR
jgi:3-deoxy-D-manno-octulosonic-acid transferase